MTTAVQDKGPAIVTGASRGIGAMAQQSPLGRTGQPGEIAATVSWLISPEASYVTGSDIPVTGGL